MTPESYQQFTQTLSENLNADPRALGLVALGSMAAITTQPDRYSDHDFFVIVRDGTQDEFKDNLSWLPGRRQVAMAFRETAHGMKALYDDGHLVEFAIFSPDELSLAKVNQYRVLFDHADVARRMRTIQRTTRSQSPPSDAYLFGQVITHLQVGVGRALRGETLSGRVHIAHYAVADLTTLLARHVPTDNTKRLDNLDPLRRFEAVYVDIGAAINKAVERPPLEAASDLLDIAEVHLRDVDGYPARAVTALREYFEGL